MRGSGILKRLILEFLGSFGYLLFGCIIELFVIHYLSIPIFSLKVLIIALGFATSFGIIYSLCNLFYDVDINPLFTFTSWLKNDISFYKVISTIFIQILGAVEAGLVILLFLPNLLDSLVIGASNHHLFSSSFNTIILVGFMASFVLTFAYFVIQKKIQSKKLRGLLLGILLFLLLFISIPFTGGSVNPARGFVSNLFVNFATLCQLNFYLFSSLAGALFSMIIYHLLSYHHNNVI